MKQTVISEIVDNDLCIGCGICAANCPDDLLKMVMNQYGEYTVIELTPCVTGCKSCLKVCPFSDSNDNEDGISHELYHDIEKIRYRKELGFYLSGYSGFSTIHRPTSSSGGLATWLIESLLKEGVVDYVVCVSASMGKDFIFNYTVYDRHTAVKGGSGSVYHPVELSTVIKKILEVPGRYAITGVPCFIKGIRLAQKKNPILKERIILTIGLVCGQLKSKNFTEYISSLAGIDGNIVNVKYRGKRVDQPASNYFYSFLEDSGDTKDIFWNEGISEAWTNRWFTPNACNYCDDVFAECADVTFMDAWLPEFQGDSEGTSLVIVRLPLIDKMFKRDTELRIRPIEIDKVIQSQAGVIDIKRRQLSFRLYNDESHGKTVPVKRVQPNKKVNWIIRREVILKERMRVKSREAWVIGNKNTETFRKVLTDDLNKIKIGRLLYTITRIPNYIIKRI